MRQVQGYVTADGKFFENSKEAKMHEAREILLKSLAQHDVSDAVLHWMEACGQEIIDYLEALDAVSNSRKSAKLKVDSI